MTHNVYLTEEISDKDHLVVLLDDRSQLKEVLSPEELQYAEKKIKESGCALLNNLTRYIYLQKIKPGEKYIYTENVRKAGADLFRFAEKEKLKELQILPLTNEKDVIPFIEGFLLASYKFNKYKTTGTDQEVKSMAVGLLVKSVQEKELQETLTVVEATCAARDLVNEPVIFLTAEQFSEEIEALGKKAGFSTEVFNKLKIQALKMGGLLAVNLGSPNPPTFNILEYTPANAVNERPVILVGKGVVYDTGGLSLKPSESMDKMKCDMAGGAAVTGALYALAKNKVPVHVVGLIPATENRPDGNAVTPGDVITMFDGKTVEVLNTDAEGRLILADALSFAKKYKPSLVIDVATLTGAAARAIGKEGIVYMGNAHENVKKIFTDSGNEVYERLVEFPLWQEYDEQLKSDIADMKNIGSGEAGAITAGKFLERFVDYDWLHLDIAGSAFLTSTDSYRGRNGTGVGVRLLYNFITKIANNNNVLS